MPYLKRISYKDESEFRVIYTNKTKDIDFLHIPIDLDCIERIVISPWVPASLTDSLKDVVKKINTSSSVSVWRSTLISNDTWKDIGKSI